MKTKIFHPLFLLVLLLTMAGGFSAKAQEDTCAVNVIHTYMNGRLVPWDSVEVRVCMPPCEYPYHYQFFKMYWPDTILANCATRIDEYVAADKLELSQNYPNPCMGESSVKLATRTAGSVRLQVMDVQGRLCCQRRETLPAGEHTLSLTFPHSGLYFVTAETADGRATCKVLCSEGKGSTFTIRLTSTSPQLVEKAERGGEGLFGMTDRMQVTAYITHNGSVLSSGTIDLNCDLDSNGVTHSEWLYHHGAINIHFTEADTCNSFTLAGETFRILVSSNVCQPFTNSPSGCTVTFYDSTFNAVPGVHFEQLSDAWNYEGMYKYRYYPAFERICICEMDEVLPPQDIASADDPRLMGFDLRSLRVTSCDVASIGLCLQDTECYEEELMVKVHCDTSCYAYDLSGSCCHWLTPSDSLPPLVLVNDMQELASFIYCSCTEIPEIDFNCQSLVVVSGWEGEYISSVDINVTHQDNTYIVNLFIRLTTFDCIDWYLKGLVINKINDIEDAQFEIVRTYRLYVVEDSFSGCQPDTMPSDTVIFQTYGGPYTSFIIQHHLLLNCSTTNVTIEAFLNDNTNTINIFYHIDDYVPDDCVCPTQLEYSIAEVLPGNYNIIFWLDDQIIHQEMYDFHW